MTRTSKGTKTLFDPETRGGVVASGGFSFQDAYIITSLPAWLTLPDFHSVLKEGFEDVDVRLDGTNGTTVLHHQLKDHAVSVPEFRKVLKRFASLEAQSSGNMLRFILACCGLAQRLAAVWRKVEEFRGASKTHGATALAESRRALLADLAGLGLDAWADFIIDRLEIEPENPWLRDKVPAPLLERFRGRFVTLPLYDHQDPVALDRLFSLLAVRIGKAVREGIQRKEIVRIVEEELAEAAKGPSVAIYLHGWARQKYAVPADHEFDWTRHFDRDALRVPQPETWNSELLPELRGIRERLDGDARKRSIWLGARAPLSAGLAFGHAFAEAAGYTIAVHQPGAGAPAGGEVWRLDRAMEGLIVLDVIEVKGARDGDGLVVGIGITDDPRPRLERFVASAGLKPKCALLLYPVGGPGPAAVSKHNVGGIASAVKREMRRFVDCHGTGIIHLFYLGPLGLAVLLGQRLNGLGDIQCYERSKTDSYVPSCRLPA